MAVPFYIPEDHNEVEVLINQLQYLLTKLQASLRRARNGTRTLSSQNTRVRTNSSNRSRLREAPSTSTSTSTSSSTTPSASASASSSTPSPSSVPVIIDIIVNLVSLVSQESIESNSQPTTLIRQSRTRTSSESSCCEESKISESTALSHGNVQDWNQETENENEIEESPKTKSYSREGILSKIVPGPVSAPLWTAMICFVGWHIFRAR